MQESKAENALAALKKMAAPLAQVIRDGRVQTMATRELVPGDVVILEAGNHVLADLRLFESANLKIEEASLTGESASVEKNAELVLDREIPLGDRLNTAFMGTAVTYGRGKGVVVDTGMHTQIGLIAEMIQSFEEERTPLQQRLAQLGRVPGIGCLAICGIVFVFGVVVGKPVLEMFMTAVSLAIAAIPEGLPAAVTICLALGMQRMLRRHALLCSLPAVETLGCATAICSDKTGTLTQNAMTVVRTYADGEFLTVTGEGYQPYGEFQRNGTAFDVSGDPATGLLLRAALLCNDSQLERRGAAADEGVTWRIAATQQKGRSSSRQPRPEFGRIAWRMSIAG